MDRVHETRWDADATRRTSLSPLRPSLRVAADFARASVCLRHGGTVLWQGRHTRLLRQRRVDVDLTALTRLGEAGGTISLGVIPARE